MQLLQHIIYQAQIYYHSTDWCHYLMPHLIAMLVLAAAVVLRCSVHVHHVACALLCVILSELLASIDDGDATVYSMQLHSDTLQLHLSTHSGCTLCTTTTIAAAACTVVAVANICIQFTETAAA